MALLELLEEESKDILLALIPNIRTLIESFCNEYCINQLPDATAANGDTSPYKGNPTLDRSKTIGGNALGDFGALHKKYEIGRPTQGFGGGFKKLPSMNFVVAQNEPEDMSGADNYGIAPEYKAEIVYQELMPKILALDEHIHNQIGLWRQHAEFLEQFSQTFKLFHMPELHDNFIQTLFKYLQTGNIQLRAKVCKCIVTIMAYQYDPERRAALAKQINEELGESRAFQIRRTFVTLCRCCAGVMPKEFFLETFYDTLVLLAGDRVAQVRMEFAKALIDLKPYIETDTHKDFELAEIIDRLKNDHD